MINSVNALEFLKPKLLTMDKYNSTTTTKLLPPSSLTPTRTFVTMSSHQDNNAAIDFLKEKPNQFLLNDDVRHQDRVRVQHLENHTKLQNNKCWNNFRTLYNVSASASSDVRNKDMLQLCQTKDDNEIVDVVNVEHLTSTTTKPTQLNIQNESAFTLDLNNKCRNNDSYNNLKMDSSKLAENSNNCKIYCKQFNNYGLINKQSTTTTMFVTSSEPQSTTQRTEDQNNAYRHIESVHNYAKSKSYEGDDDDITSPNGSRQSSLVGDDEDDDDEDDIDDAEYDNDDDIDYEDRLQSNADQLADDLDADYEDIFSKRRYRRFEKFPTLSDGGARSNNTNKVNSKGSAHFGNILKQHKMQPIKVNNDKIKRINEDEEVHIDVDVETVDSQSSPNISVLGTNPFEANNGIIDESASSVKPDHHARRPMNAFLIFCKRHRAIVKERYKNLENRAITKILGDWWASLDINDKECFTNLAQQNKDAFFSANPNFKWYKLPAPPLRTLTTRPANAFGQEYQEDNEVNGLEIISNNTRYSNNKTHSNYFKLADEAQMGDLSQLMQEKSKATKQCAADLQQVLGETSQFMSAHITGNSEAMEENHLKRRFYNENSFSSNSSEEDVVEPKEKISRSCKGKRYQELINSGQIATALKKSKPSSTRTVGSGVGPDSTEMNIKHNLSNVNYFNNNNNNVRNSVVCQKHSLSECENMMYDINSFDLEERIKELPALDLDDYLQRKRNTKKKKKFSSNGKKRGQRSHAINNTSNINCTSSNDKDNLTAKTSLIALSNENLPQQHQALAKQHQQAAAAVGSQKRKARKESITRRDVSAIEQEVASLLPLTINGCCYFQEAPAAIKYIKIIEKDTEAAPQSLNGTSMSTSPIIPLKENRHSSSSVSIDILNNTNIINNNNNHNHILNDNISSTTSDLLILAEVAANRTELKH